MQNLCSTHRQLRNNLFVGGNVAMQDLYCRVRIDTSGMRKLTFWLFWWMSTGQQGERPPPANLLLTRHLLKLNLLLSASSWHFRQSFCMQWVLDVVFFPMQQRVFKKIQISHCVIVFKLGLTMNKKGTNIDKKVSEASGKHFFPVGVWLTVSRA